MKALPTPFIDMLFILIAYLLLMIAPNVKKEQTPQPKQLAEFIINVTWPSEADSDIDTWIMRSGFPESITGWRRRENDVFILHNDNTSGSYGMVDGEPLDFAREVMTIEKIKEDYYVLSLHGFSITNGYTVKVLVEMQKSNPYTHVFSKEVEVTGGQETPVAAWHIDKDGNIVPGSLITNQELLVKFLW